ncbi:MAG TPA: MarR family winged helix-turn-helix transcriptional regulator [Sphingomonas sp.]|nr:MarR family winged helix-turn-helix transcriptional regulator [Sphingomonas sp.]
MNDGVSGNCATACPLVYLVSYIVCKTNIYSSVRIDAAPRSAQAVSMSYQSATIDRNEDIGDIDRIVGFHIRLAHGAVYRHFTETFADLDLTQKQVSALWLIDDHRDIAQADIGRRLQMDRATVMAIINRLQKRGFVERGASTGDRRRQTLHLTATGHAALVKARTSILEHEAWLKARFNQREIDQLVKLLRRIHE